MQGERFAVWRQALGRLDTRRARNHRRGTLRRGGHGLGILIEQRRAPADRPGGGSAEPFARGVAEGASQFGVFDVRTAVAGQPVRIEGILVRLAQRRPEHAGLLGLPPGYVLVREGPHEALHGFHRVGALARLGCLRPCPWYEPSPLGHLAPTRR